jgi:hypothetical protein
MRPPLNDEGLRLARQLALLSRQEHYRNHPENFRRISGTCAVTPRTEYLRKMANFKIKPASRMDTAGVDIAGFEFIPCLIKGKLYVEPGQIKGIEAERILRLKIYYQETYCINPYGYDSWELYTLLPEFIQMSLLYDHQGQHAYAASYIFGEEEGFRSVAYKCNANPFLIAEAYRAPPCYAMFEMAQFGICESHFWTAMDKEPTRIIGNGNLWQENIKRRDLLISILGDLSPEWHDQFIYRYTRVGDNHFLCLGGSREKRGRIRTHVFGLNLEYVDAAMRADMDFFCTRFNTDMLK